MLEISDMLSKYNYKVRNSKFFQEKMQKYIDCLSNKNDIKAQYELGLTYFILGNINKAIEYFTFAESQNYLNAQLILGEIYLGGKYVTRDINKAILYFSHAADQNDIKAQNNLGNFYFNQHDIKKAIKYYTKAVELGSSDAKDMLEELSNQDSDDE